MSRLSQNAETPADIVYCLRACASDGTSYGGFRWPESGLVVAPDWDPTASCGGGLHGFLWGEGNGRLARWDCDAKWLVFTALSFEVVDLGGKIKVPRCEVVFCGARQEATAWLARKAPGRAIIGGTATAGDGGTATAGERGMATAGERGMATAGERGMATAGEAGTATAGERGMATAGYRGTATAGDDGMATAGYRGTATAGHRGTATAGHSGTATAGDRGTAITGDNGSATAGDGGMAMAGYGGMATAGDGGVIQIWYWDGRRDGRRRCVAGYVGEDGILPNVPYCIADGRLTVATASATNLEG